MRFYIVNNFLMYLKLFSFKIPSIDPCCYYDQRESYLFFFFSPSRSLLKVLDDLKQNEFNEEEVDQEYEEFLQMQREFAELRVDLPAEKPKILAIEVFFY